MGTDLGWPPRLGLVVLLASGSGLVTAGAAGAQDRSPRLHLTPEELARLPRTGPSAGTSGVTGIQTTVVAGQPGQPGLYTILLRVPAHTEIAAHTHPDDRIATVLKGTWYFGYGTRVDTGALKTLPTGSIYKEPPGVAHFARTGDSDVVVEITGFGPTGTQYIDPKHEPRSATPAGGQSPGH